MSAPALEALAAAKAAGVTITLDGDGLILEADPLPPDIVALLKTVKPDLLRVLAGREAARAAFDATPPPDCSERGWAAGSCGPTALRQGGLGRPGGAHSDGRSKSSTACRRVWGRVDLTGAALLIGDRKVVAVTEASIAIETRSGSHLKFRRIGREHIA